MNVMTKGERVKAAINKQEVDRLPVNVWGHVPHYDQDPIRLAEYHVAYLNQYDFDFIKLMPFGNYVAVDFGLSCDYFCTPDKPVFEREFGIKDPSEWYGLKPLPAYYGTYGKVLQIAQYTKKFLGKSDAPIIQTVFSPLTIAQKLCGPRTIEDLRKHPEALKAGLEAITETQKNFLKANIEAGIDGFFFASQLTREEYCTREEYMEFGAKYDLEMLSVITPDVYFNVAHICRDKIYFDIMANYPQLSVINWHDRWSSVDTAMGRKLTDKCLMGGINDKLFHELDPEGVIENIGEAVSVAGKRGFIVAPGCCVKTFSPPINYYAARIGAEKWSK